MSIYTYIAEYGSYESQTIVIIANDTTQALQKLKAYLIKEGYTKLADEAQEKDLTEETEDVFQTYGIDG
jgi:DUF438 domain-containing protein